MPYNTPSPQDRPALLAVAEKLAQAADAADRLPNQRHLLGQVEQSLALAVEIYLHAAGVPADQREAVQQAVFDTLATGATLTEAITAALQSEAVTWA